MGEDFVLDDGSIIEDEDILEGHSRNFRYENPPKSISQGGIDADKREARIERFVQVEFDSEILSGKSDISHNDMDSLMHASLNFCRFHR